ncbi:PREDICTED: uncharacterized protein LOC105311928 [Amphimedon queenslandica]|nr:PREDICTED: uncharacterized protein LOC105311928 [Amphimedon queenslandica]|eukprot:XP_011402474.2 PREDICTED: uncharacterized protein LOC105311928 [Amphimedon queenslandica]
MLRERSCSRDQQRKIITHSLESLHDAALTVTGSRDPLSRYQLLLCKELVLNIMELIFLSIDEEKEEEEYIVSIQSLLDITQFINDGVSVGVARNDCQRPRLAVADIFDTFVLARGRVICDSILATSLLPLHRIKCLYNFNEILTKSIIGLIKGVTSLLTDSRSKFCRGKTWQECIRLVDGFHDSGLCLRINTRIWQCVGDRLLSILSVEDILESELRDKVKALLHQFISSHDTNAVALYSPAIYCFKYVLARLDVEASNDIIYNAIEENIHLLHVSSYKLASSNVIQSLSKSILSPMNDSVSLLSLTFKNHGSKINEEKTQAVAIETDRLHLFCPLLYSVHSLIWSLGRWLTLSIKDSIISGRLSAITSLFFIHGPLLLKMEDELINGCGQAGVAHLSLPRSSSQYWVGQYCGIQYGGLSDCSEWIEYQLSSLCCTFFNQWREKCRQILETHFPPPSAWKQQKGGDDAPSFYVSVCKEQLIDPLLQASQSLVDTVTQCYVVQISVSILFYELRAILMKDDRYKLSSVGVLQLRKDYTELLSLLTEPANGLHSITHSLIALLGVACDIKAGLDLLTQESSPSENTATATSEVKGCQDHYLLRIGRSVDIIEKVAWLNHRDWNNLK